MYEIGGVDTQLEADIKNWGLSRNVYGREPALNSYLSFEKGVQSIFTEGKSVRATLEELKSADRAKLVEIGVLK